MSSSLGGMVVLDGLLDPEGGATLLTALSALRSAGRAGDDDRSPAQWRADALVELARRGFEAGVLAELAGERPHVTVTVELATLAGRPGAPAADMDGAGPVCGETARRLACDAGVARVVVAGASEPLDVGRRTRVVPPALRRALVVRDRGCAFPGCDRPPAWTDAHHLRHWAHGGRTTLDNIALLCRRHHRAVHEGGWRLGRGPDGRLVATPPPARTRPPPSR